METMALRRRNRIAPIAGALGADKRAAAAARAARRAPAAPRRAAPHCRCRRLPLIYVRRVSFLMSP